jgi:hypothetical protein
VEVVDINMIHPKQQTQNKQIAMICPKGHRFEQTLYYLTVNDPDKQRRCNDKVCIDERKQATCLEKFGVVNVSQVQEFKEKGVHTNMVRDITHMYPNR